MLEEFKKVRGVHGRQAGVLLTNDSVGYVQFEFLEAVCVCVCVCVCMHAHASVRKCIHLQPLKDNGHFVYYSNLSILLQTCFHKQNKLQSVGVVAGDYSLTDRTLINSETNPSCL